MAILSYFYFRRLFVRLVKKPVQGYIKPHRLAHACKGLKNKENRIIDIAFNLGFGNHEAFTRAFKEACNLIPIPIRNMEKDILKIAGFSAFSKCAFP
ncbi:MAG: helix-turn-helix domain-containing protein [Defluviitaleaceae bacterium]|nr:helix-turn-helix domain-containing protein [Defluviitaleaceae bacterium]